ncbi:mercury(II) reductase [Varunaivibrio sulfuroxidans]|uniref:Mercuric reductase n=1 Tax=Varunaivibrio sulfuroxidans TaxID=1773489 RepID=A0A4R3JAF3_9PROT|nr:mercury(II) reductase [Varunaivibrio sulfuroxidans]TCS62959.1 mercury(II) reductase [Varunaivibrio sulfuroxidans]WES31963.1 mercury(II) reductase [Varunaivibrio sulfuroxidans]
MPQLTCDCPPTQGPKNDPNEKVPTEGKPFDVAVIGAGSAGFSAAITAAEAGARVALIGAGTIGGTCVNVGCVPSKAMIRAVETQYQARAARRFDGIEADARIIDWAATVAQKDTLVAQLRQAKYIDLLPSYDNVTYIEGRARLGEGVVIVDGEAIEAGKIIIATGSSSAVPDIPGIDGVPYLTSTEALDLKTLPTSLIVVGGGYIGCEMAQMFARAGVRVTLVCRSRLLPAAEPEISAALSEYLRDEGVDVRGGLSYHEIMQTPDGITLEIDKNDARERLNAEKVLVCTGRRANTDGLGLAEIGVALSPGGAIVVDAHMRTTKPDIYGAGDVTGRDQFVYMAAYGAKLAAKNAMTDDHLTYDNSAMPWIVFTDPQVAGVGLSAAQAKANGLDVKTSVLDLKYVPRALAARDTRGLIKLVAERQSGVLLGAQILAPEGADTIQTVAMAIKGGLTASDLADTIFPYLTTVEGLKLAAQTFDKDVAKLSCCAG